MGVRAVFLSGGEPLLVRGLQAAISKWAAADIAVYLFTSGWNLNREIVDSLSPLLAAIHVSLDGATSQVHDKVRGRAGSFEKTLGALSMLEAAATEHLGPRHERLQFGVDATLIQSNFADREAIVRLVLERFPHASFVNLGAAVPSGIASTPWFASHELLKEEQLEALRKDGKGLATPRNTLVSCSDQQNLQMHPDDVSRGIANMDTWQMEPDGEVRAMAIYEGTVGNILAESPHVIWQRAQARWMDPFVVQQLEHARTRVDWAAATRAIDDRFCASTERGRVRKHLAVMP